MLDHQREAVIVAILCVPLLLNIFLSLSRLITRHQYIFPNFPRESNARITDHSEQSYWFALVLSKGSCPNSIQLTWFRELHFGVGPLDAPVTLGVFQKVFDSCTISKKSVFLFIFYCFQRIFAARNLRAVKKHLVKQKERKQWETSPLFLGTTVGHR